MSTAAILWVLVSAAAHVAWNTQLKRTQNPQAFSWLLQLVGFPLALAVTLVLRRPLDLPWQGVVCASTTGVLFGAYYTLIAKSYERGDLSLTYPMARGVAPLASAVWGIAFYREHPSLQGWCGIALICGAVLLGSYPEWINSRTRVSLVPVALAIAAGLCTSGYSAVDKSGVRFVDPVLYLALCFLGGAVAQGTFLLSQPSRAAIWPEARRTGRWLVPCAALDLGGYLIILFVLKSQPVSYVVPLRSVSVVMSVVVGIALLGEKATWQRAVAAGMATAGIVALALG